MTDIDRMLTDDGARWRADLTARFRAESVPVAAPASPAEGAGPLDRVPSGCRGRPGA